MKKGKTTRRMIAPSLTTVLIFSWPFCTAQADYFSPSTYWECILDKMPDATDDRIASDTQRQCQKEFPNTEEYEIDAWRIFGPGSHEECMSSYIQQTRSIYARTMLQQACFRLFSRK